MHRTNVKFLIHDETVVLNKFDHTVHKFINSFDILKILDELLLRKQILHSV